MTKVRYREYLQSPEWQVKRRAALARANSHCSVCRQRTNLEVHHNTYARLGNERSDDLIVLCSNCHHLYEKNGRLCPSVFCEFLDDLCPRWLTALKTELQCRISPLGQSLIVRRILNARRTAHLVQQALDKPSEWATVATTVKRISEEISDDLAAHEKYLPALLRLGKEEEKLRRMMGERRYLQWALAKDLEFLKGLDQSRLISSQQSEMLH